MKNTKKLLVIIVAILFLATGCSSSEIFINKKNNQKTREYTSLEVLAHIPYFNMYDIDTNWDSDREKAIKKAENLLTKSEGKYIKLEKKLLKEDFYGLTSGTSSLIYYGDVKNNRPHGFGIIASSRGDISSIIYCGEFKDGRFDGYGIGFNEERSYFVADTSDDYFNVSIESFLGNYATYDGTWKDGKYSGKGILYSVNMSSIIVNSSDTHEISEIIPDIKMGDFKKGLLYGEVLCYSNNILEFEGSVKNNLPNGKGTSYYSDGTIKYSGEWKSGEYHGKGTLYDNNGKKEYSGKWKNGDYEK